MHDRDLDHSRISRARWRKSFDHSPLVLFYELTRPSSCDCNFCRVCESVDRYCNDASTERLGTEQAKLLIDQMQEFPDPPMLVLIGGDPQTRPDVFELIEYAVDSGLNVSIAPNSTSRWTRAALARLRYAGVVRVAIQVNGADGETHDVVASKHGSYDHSIEILRHAREVRLETQINTTLSSQNIDQIDAMADRFAKLDIAQWSVFFPVPNARATNTRFGPQQCEMVFEKLWRQSKHQSYLIKTTEAPHFRRFLFQKKLAEGNHSEASPQMRALRWRGINDGRGVMFVGPTGQIQPSGFLPVTCGLFPLQSIVEVYQSSLGFTLLRDADRLQGKCGLCEFRNICGGSRARAYAVTRNWMAQDPDCNYLPQAMRSK